MVLHAVERLEAWIVRQREALYRRLGRGVRLLPWFALAYGLASGFSIQRDYAHSTALLAALAGLALAQVAFRIWIDFAQRGVDAIPEKRALMRHFVERKHVIERFSMVASGYCAQYILMFCIPLLFLAHAWITLALALLAATSTLWDAWHARLVRLPLYTVLVRVFAAVLATSFAFAVVWPKALRYFHPILGLVAVVNALPWDAFWRRSRPTGRELAPLALVGATVLAQAALGTWLRVPLLSVWLQRPALGLVVEHLELSEAWSDSVPVTHLSEALQSQKAVCCLSPVVSPSGVEAAVVHEWRVDGKLVDRIKLPPVRGLGAQGEKPFRTYSCKRNLSEWQSAETIGCRILLEGSIFLGDVTVTLER